MVYCIFMLDDSWDMPGNSKKLFYEDLILVNQQANLLALAM